MDRKIEKKGLPWKKILLFGGAGILVLFFLNKLYQDAGTSRLNVQTERLLIDTINRGVFQEFIPVTGVVQPIKTVFIDAVEGGRVEEKYVEDGTMVSKGQKIVQLSNPDLQLNYINQEANIVAQINQIRTLSIQMEQQSLNLKEQALDVAYRLDLLEKRTRRNSELFSDQVISRVDFEETEDEYEHLQRREKMLSQTIRKDSMFQEMQQDQMEMSLNLMQKNLDFSRKSLDNLTVRAPISGQLSGFEAELGELITEGENIAQMDDLSNYKVRARIDEFYISRIFIDQEGSFVFAGDAYGLKIKKIYPQVTNGAFEVDMIFTGEVPEGIKRGQTVSIKLQLSAEKQALLLAKGSFFQTTGGNWVYVIDPASGTAQKREIRVGNQNPNYYEVLSGLSSGELVITSSYENFGDKDELVLQ